MKASISQATRSTAYRRAQGHSRRVAVVKFALPVVALAGLLLIVGAIYMPRILPDVSVDLANTAITDGKLVMANPKLDGFTPDKRAYTVTATRATQNLDNSGAVELENLRATVEMSDGETAVLVSDTGNYDNTANSLELPNPSTMEMTDGTTAQMARSNIDMRSGSVDAFGGVTISRNGTRISAETMKVSENGKRVVFEKTVRLVMDPKRGEKVTTASGPTGGQ